MGLVPPTFYLEVKRNRTTPFWLHPVLQPEGLPHTNTPSSTAEDLSTADTDGKNQSGNDEEIEEGDDGLIDMEPMMAVGDHGTFRERLTEHIRTIRDFCDGLEYQLEFEDHRMLETVERDGASFLRLAHSCLSRECRMNSLRGVSPTTWERETARAMFYRTRPSRRDIES